jgi:hypothetical protein
VWALIFQRLTFLKDNGLEELLLCGGGDMYLPGKDRCPDTALRPFPPDGEKLPMPRLICEIEITHRGLEEFLEHNDHLFAGIPQLRATNLLKAYPRDAVSRRFGALALLFRRLPGGVTCIDAVSCGTGPLHATIVRDLPPAVGGILRHLGVVPTELTRESPWPAAQNPNLLVPAETMPPPVRRRPSLEHQRRRQTCKSACGALSAGSICLTRSPDIAFLPAKAALLHRGDEAKIQKGPQMPCYMPAYGVEIIYIEITCRTIVSRCQGIGSSNPL